MILHNQSHAITKLYRVIGLTLRHFRQPFFNDVMTFESNIFWDPKLWKFMRDKSIHNVPKISLFQDLLNFSTNERLVAEVMVIGSNPV